MREKGFDRSPNMCTNLLKEFKKVKEHNGVDCHNGYLVNRKMMQFYKQVEEEIFRGRNKVESFMQFFDKGTVFIHFSCQLD
ncbi:hypothetical protein HanHA300_Chr17g0642241 [Helianthus annuus]|nr:hypothetical protein HanHA300_Chr17g0642241 [Helianthus annuus]KAJ0446392.1 hypothetical protein HanHA89_Chr17g0693811 [Helianthus annuus]